VMADSEEMGRTMKQLPVTVEVSTNDLADVIAWATEDRGRTLSARNFRLLAIYRERPEMRETVFDAAPTSLQWCLHTYETKGVEALQAILDAADAEAAAGPDDEGAA